MSVPPPSVPPLQPSSPLPQPARIRAQRPDGFPPPARPPFGLAEWSDDPAADAVAFVVQLAFGEPSATAHAMAIAEQLPPAEALPPGTLLVILPDALRARGLLGPLLGPKREHLGVAERTTALLAQGYVALGAARDVDGRTELAWGYAAAFAGHAEAPREPQPATD